MSLTLLVLQVPNPPDGWEKAGIVTILVLAVFLIGTAFLREWVVTGTRYKAKEEDCNMLRKDNEALRADNMRLWGEKVEDAKESGELARAILRVREHG